MSDITIPGDVAKDYAKFIRHLGGRYADLADLLDPKPLTLRDEAYRASGDAWSNTWAGASVAENCADAVLAVVRKRIEALPSKYQEYTASRQALRDVLALFDGEAS